MIRRVSYTIRDIKRRECGGPLFRPIRVRRDVRYRYIYTYVYGLKYAYGTEQWHYLPVKIRITITIYCHSVHMPAEIPHAKGTVSCIYKLLWETANSFWPTGLAALLSRD